MLIPLSLFLTQLDKFPANTNTFNSDDFVKINFVSE